MIIEFTIGNFLSFKNPVTFSFLASKDKSLEDTNIIEFKKGLKILKNLAIYGSNASGKSNIFKTLSSIQQFIMSSATYSEGSGIDLENFKLDIESKDRPSLFEIIFIINKRIYRYGFEINKKMVLKEWLFAQYTSRESKMFSRTRNNIKIGSKLKVGMEMKKVVKSNALFLSTLANFKIDIIQNIINKFKNIIIFSNDIMEEQFWRSMTISLFKEKNEESLKLLVRDLMKSADLGIEDIYTKERRVKLDVIMKKAPTEFKDFFKTYQNVLNTSIKVKHKKYNKENEIIKELVEFDLDTNESRGTSKFFSLIGLIVMGLFGEFNIFIDELDTSLHPVLVEKIIQLFNLDKKYLNKSQFFFSTHNTNLLDLDILRRDQIYFIDKNKFGASNLYALSEFKVRKDSVINKNYLSGRFGAVPKLYDDMIEVIQKHIKDTKR